MRNVVIMKIKKKHRRFNMQIVVEVSKREKGMDKEKTIKS